jgi:hypothetical protein
MNLCKKLRTTFALAVAASLVFGGAAWAAPAKPAKSAAAYSLENREAKSNAAIQSIIGVWNLKGAPDETLLAIHKDGTYEFMDKGGDGSCYGTVKVVSEKHPDGSITRWYNFYKSDGTQWIGFTKNEAKKVETDLFSGHDGAAHFVRRLENKYSKTGKNINADSYLGTWACGRCTLVIEKEDRGYLVNVKWASSAADGSNWTYHCVYDDYSAILLCNGSGTRVDYAFDDSGKESCEERYNNGTGIFVMRKGVLTWQDKKENAGESIEFIR